MYRGFIATCKRAGIEIETLDAQGRVVEHVDLHSTRRTFATNLIENGTDPRTVQELLGHKTLSTTMKVYAKVRSQTKRQAIGRLSYGRGVTAPAGLLAFPGGSPNATRPEPSATSDPHRPSQAAG